MGIDQITTNKNMSNLIELREAQEDAKVKEMEFMMKEEESVDARKDEYQEDDDRNHDDEVEADAIPDMEINHYE